MSQQTQLKRIVLMSGGAICGSLVILGILWFCGWIHYLIPTITIGPTLMGPG